MRVVDRELLLEQAWRDQSFGGDNVQILNFLHQTTVIYLAERAADNKGALAPRTMQQQIKEEPIDADAAQLQRAQAGEAAPHARDTAALWRAAAGMAISLALACAIVMLEFTGQAAHRADRVNRLAGGLLSKVSRLEVQDSGRARADLPPRIANSPQHETLRALLRAPDAGMLRLLPPMVAGIEAAPAASSRSGARA